MMFDVSEKIFGVQNLYSWISISYRTILLSYPTIVSFGFSLCLQLFSPETSPSFFSIHNMVSFIFIHSQIWVWISYHSIVILKMRSKLIFHALKELFLSLIRCFRLRGTSSFRSTPFQIANIANMISCCSNDSEVGFIRFLTRGLTLGRCWDLWHNLTRMLSLITVGPRCLPILTRSSNF